jgi:hypothetical protein
MPFASQAQRRYMYARHPAIAKRWRKEHGPQHDLPERTGNRDRRDVMVKRFVRRQRR